MPAATVRIHRRRASDLGQAVIVRRERLSPSSFLAIIKKEARAIQHARIAPPRLGGMGLGSIVVEYSTPRLRQR